MPSPIKPSDICASVVTGTSLLCDKFKQLLDLPKTLCKFFTWFLNPDGTIAVEFKKELSQVTIPLGMPQFWPYLGSIPSGYIILNGQAVSRITYADYFTICGTSFGAGNGTTTFNVPDMQGRVAMGVSGFYAAGTTGGESAHTLTLAELPTGKQDWRIEGSGAGDITGLDVIQGNIGTGPQTGTLTTGVNGGGLSHNNLQPYLAGYWIARVKTL